MLLDADKPSETIHMEEFEVHALLSQIISGLRVQFEKKKIGLQLLSNNKVTAISDKNKLSQSIYNILTNAYKFTGPKGSVEISYEASDTHISIRIKDSGIGIAKEDLPYLFDAYYRGHNAGETVGDGLGLFVVKENLEQLGGTISVRSEQGMGSEFIIEFPVKKQDNRISAPEVQML
jgi:signal transduction histidine kinase